MTALPAWPGLAQRDHEVPEAFWRSLSYFNLSRMLLAGLLLGAMALYGDNRMLGASDPLLFRRACVAYLALALVFWWLLRRVKTLFAAHLAIHAVSDVVIITLLLHASGGVRSGLGILLLMPLAAAASVSRGRTSLFYASIATFALFVENSYWVLQYEIGWTDYFPVGLLAAGCFSVALVTNRLAKRLIANEALVRQRSADLRHQIEVNRLVIRDMPGGVLVVDADDVVRLANPEAERLLGRAGLQGSRLAGLAPALSQAGLAWREARGIARRTVRVAGHEIHVRLLDPAGGTGGEILMFLEDSGKLRLQAQQVKLAALGRLTANIAHEIRNPLSAISHAAALLGEEATGSNSAVRLTRIIGDNTARLDRIVQEVLQLNRRDRAVIEEIALQPFLRTFLEQIGQAEGMPGAAFRLYQLPGAVVYFDRQHLYRILWNLVGNAWRHSSQQAGSITIDISAADGGMIDLHVVDDGIGVDEEKAGNLFEPFFTTEARGTGLGLYIARELAEANRAILDYVLPSERDPGVLARAGNRGADFRLQMEGHVKPA